jgi:hypothetical protein
VRESIMWPIATAFGSLGIAVKAPNILCLQRANAS